MPTNSQRFWGAVTSICITVGGAWLANLAHSTPTDAAALTYPSGVTVTFEGVRSSDGQVIVMVFGDREAFKAYDVERAVGYREAPARPGSVTVAFPELQAGPYAIAAFHDEDGDQDFDMDGEWPLEGYATSGASDAHDMPTFRQATIRGATVVTEMFYAE